MLWAAAVVSFFLISVLLKNVGPSISHDVAVNFHRNRIDIALDEGNHREYINESKAWVWIEPENPEAVINVVTAYLVTGDWLGANETLDRYRPNASLPDYDYYRLMTYIQSQAGAVEASTWADRASSEASDPADGLLLKAHTVRLFGNGDEAEKLYTEILSLHPNHGEALFYLSIFAENRADTDSVFRYREALASASSDLTYTPSHLQRISQANRFVTRLPIEFREKGARPPSRVEALAQAQLTLGMWESAMQSYASLAEENTGSWEADFWLALDADHKGDTQSAKKYVENAIKKNPTYKSLRTFAARLAN